MSARADRPSPTDGHFSISRNLITCQSTVILHNFEHKAMSLKRSLYFCCDAVASGSGSVMTPSIPRYLAPKLSSASASRRCFSGSSTRQAQPDHYGLMNLPTNATKQQIKARFYEVSRAWAGRSGCGGTSLVFDKRWVLMIALEEDSSGHVRRKCREVLEDK